jgi:hypothetical protein
MSRLHPEKSAERWPGSPRRSIRFPPQAPPVWMINAYVDRFDAAAEDDVVFTEQFFRVAGLLEPPTRLLRPATMLRVLAGNLRTSGARSLPCPI